MTLACRITGLPSLATPTIPSTPTLIPSPLPPIPVEPGAKNPDEPVYITGDIPFTSPFFISSTYEPFVLLEDEAGAVKHNKDFTFRLDEQVIGPVELHGSDKPLTYSLALPSVPQGTQLDLDNNGVDNSGVQVFAIAYWSNTWDGPFLEPRDGRGWSTAYVSTITDPEQDDAIIGGTLIVWSPDDQQSFPSGFGPDKKLFTSDDPVAPIPAGYNIVDLSKDPFTFSKEARPRIVLNEGEIAVNDYSSMTYAQAFEALISKVEREYPFTKEKNVNWQALKSKYAPEIDKAKDDTGFYKVLHNFIQEIPDAHVGMPINGQIFFDEHGGGFGLVLAELSDGRVLVTKVFPKTAGDLAGIQVGAEILTWDSQPVTKAIDAVQSYFGPYSTAAHRRLDQVIFLTHVPVDTVVKVSFQNSGDTTAREVSLKAEAEYDSLFAAIQQFNLDPVAPPVEGQILDESGLGYIRVNTFLEDYSLMARLWEHYIKGMIDNKVPGLIIDLRSNSGGNADLATQFAGYFFDKTIPLFQSYYYSEITKTFEVGGLPELIEPGPMLYNGPLAVLVSPYCVSACEGFAYALSQEDRSIVVGHFPTAGGFGEVGRGQYKLPGNITMQFPTGRNETPDGKVALEGVGVVPTITVPVTEDGALGKQDDVLNAAIKALLEKK
jgi:carboxyl-terminal processing protease